MSWGGGGLKFKGSGLEGSIGWGEGGVDNLSISFLKLTMEKENV